jgi:hypothetical protein
MFKYGLTSVNWLSLNLEEFIGICEKRVNDGDSFLNKVKIPIIFYFFIFEKDYY